MSCRERTLSSALTLHPPICNLGNLGNWKMEKEKKVECRTKFLLPDDSCKEEFWPVYQVHIMLQKTKKSNLWTETNQRYMLMRKWQTSWTSPLRTWSALVFVIIWVLSRFYRIVEQIVVVSSNLISKALQRYERQKRIQSIREYIHVSNQ